MDKAELVITSKPEDNYLDAGCSICPVVKFHLSGNALEQKQMLRRCLTRTFADITRWIPRLPRKSHRCYCGTRRFSISSCAALTM